MTPTEQRILNLVIEWDNTHYLLAIALIESELKREAKNLVKERREAENSEKPNRNDTSAPYETKGF